MRLLEKLPPHGTRWLLADDSVFQVTSVEGRCRSGTLRRKLKRVRSVENQCPPDAECIAQVLRIQMSDNAMLPSPDPLFSCCSVQHDGQTPACISFPVHGHDLHHLSAQGRLWFQGEHGAAGTAASVTQTITCCHVRNTCDILSFFHLGEQEGEQCGVELGFGSHIGLFLQTEHPLS